MLRAADKRLFLTQALPSLFGGRDVLRFYNSKQGRLDVPTAPPIDGYVGWWDASDRDTLTQSAGKVTAWADKSATGDNGTLETGYPQSYLYALNGRGIIVGKTNADFSVALTSSSRTQSLFWVGSLDNLNAQRVLVGSSANNGRVWRVETSGKIAAVKRNVIALATTTTLTVTTGVLFAAGLVLDTNTVEMHLNSGTPESFSNSTTFTGGLTSILCGGDALSTITPPCAVAEVVAYNSALSTANAQAVIKYLMTKWAIS